MPESENGFQFPSPYGVSFILMLHMKVNERDNEFIMGFRLLMEYHSFLLKVLG